MKEELLIAVLVGAILTAVLFTHFSALVEVIGEVIASIFKFTWIIITAVLIVLKKIIEGIIDIISAVLRRIFPNNPSSSTSNDNTTNS